MPKKFKTCVQMSRGFKNNFKRMKQKLRAWGIFIQCIFGVSPQTANEALNDSHDRLQEDETKSKIVFRRVRVKALIFKNRNLITDLERKLWLIGISPLIMHSLTLIIARALTNHHNDHYLS